MDKAEQPTTQSLKPCPFCGGEAELRENGYQVHCATGCTANVNDDYAPEAIAAWNARTTSLAAQECSDLSEELHKSRTDKRPSPIHELHHSSEGRVEIETTAQTMGEALKRLDATTPLAAQEALAGYRAAVSFISADSWDGCSDCINILKAARCADMTDAMTINETAEHLKRIRLHYDPAALPAAPSLAAQDGLVEALRVAREYVQNVVDAEGKAFNVRDLVQIDAALSAIKEQHHD